MDFLTFNLALLLPVLTAPATMPKMFRFDAHDQAGNACVHIVAGQTQQAAQGLYSGCTGISDASVAAYAPSNAQLQKDWAAGGFTMLSVS